MSAVQASPENPARARRYLDVSGTHTPRYAMSRLGGLPHAQVYLDAGNPGMFANPARLAGPLVRAGIRAGRGFAAGQYWAGYAEQLAQGMERRGG